MLLQLVSRIYHSAKNQQFTATTDTNADMITELSTNKRRMNTIHMDNKAKSRFLVNL
jgi:hypothetical protein